MHSVCWKLCIVYQYVTLVIHNCIAIVDKRQFRMVFMVSIISLQTITTPPPQPNNRSEAPTQYLHFFGSILPVERTWKFLVRNSWVMGVQRPCRLYTVDYVGWSMACARIQGAKGLLFVANVVLLVLRSCPFAMQRSSFCSAKGVQLQWKGACFVYKRGWIVWKTDWKRWISWWFLLGRFLFSVFRL